MSMDLGIRWTIGDVSPRGFEALRLSVWGAFHLFGPGAAYAVCVNSIPIDRARALAGELPPPVAWVPAPAALPPFLRPHLDAGMAQGVAWKLSPLRLFPDRRELSLDNDCILWSIPPPLRAWLDDPDPGACLLAADVRPCFGQFAALCGPEPRNSGIRGLPARFDLEGALREVLRRCPAKLTSELDEQGLQVAALRLGPLHVVSTDDVAICSPFPPHQVDLGRCGAHFVGQNVRRAGFHLEGRPAEDHLRDHWRRHRAAVYARVGIAPDRP
jgi:hypothetical protein